MLHARLIAIGLLILAGTAAGRAGDRFDDRPAAPGPGPAAPAPRTTGGCPTLPDSLLTDHFAIAYVSDSGDLDEASPERAAEAAQYLEKAWRLFTQEPRFAMPPPTGTGTLGPDGPGRVLVNIRQLGSVGTTSWVQPFATCETGPSPIIHVTSTASGWWLEQDIALMVWHACSGHLRSGDDWFYESAGTWASWQATPGRRRLDELWALVRFPNLPLMFHEPYLRPWGGALYWGFLEERYGLLATPLLYHRTCDGTPWEVALDELLRETDLPSFDETLAEFWRWNYRTGVLDDGRHYPYGDAVPEMAFQAQQESYGPGTHGVESARLAQAGGTNAVLFLGPAGRERLRIRVDGSPATAGRREVSVVTTVWPSTHSEDVVLLPDANGDVEFVIEDWHLVDQAVLILTNYLTAAEIDPAELAYTWIAEEEGPTAHDTRWSLSLEELRASMLAAAPSPFAGSTQIRYRVRPGGSTALRVYDVSGRLVRTLVDGRIAEFEGDGIVNWDGTGDDGRAAPGGVYFLALRGPGLDVTRRVALLR